MTRYTAFRCPEELLEKAKAKAARDRRSLSNYIIMLIEKDVGGAGSSGKRHGRKPAERVPAAAARRR
jgi:hypothetical protein